MSHLEPKEGPRSRDPPLLSWGTSAPERRKGKAARLRELPGSARRWGGGKVIALARTKVPKGAPLALPVSEFLSSFPLYPLKLSVCKCDYELGASYPPPQHTLPQEWEVSSPRSVPRTQLAPSEGRQRGTMVTGPELASRPSLALQQVRASGIVVLSLSFGVVKSGAKNMRIRRWL